jgi:hypothetical protein
MVYVALDTALNLKPGANATACKVSDDVTSIEGLHKLEVDGTVLPSLVQ